MLEKIKKIDFRSGIIYFGLALMWILFTILTKGNFLTSRNLSNLIRVVSTTGIVACSTVLVIVSGGIDLSTGYVAMLSGCAAAYLMVKAGWGVAPTILAVLLMGLVIGTINGFIITRTGLAPFIVTLATQMVFYGCAYLITAGTSIAPLPDSFDYFGQEYISAGVGWILAVIASIFLLLLFIHSRKEKIKYGFKTDSVPVMMVKWALFSAIFFGIIAIMNDFHGLPVQTLVMLIVMVVLYFVSTQTTWGRSIFAIGGNREAASYSGINVQRNWMFVYSLQSTMAALAGMILAAKVNSGTMQNGINLHTDSIAAAVIGGTRMGGGVGTVPGAIIGALFISTIDNGMSMMNLGIAYQYVAKGLVLLGAVVLDALSKRSRK